MAYTPDNKRTRNCCKRTLVQLNVEDVVTCFETVNVSVDKPKSGSGVMSCRVDGPPWLRVFWQVFVCTCRPNMYACSAESA